MRRRIIAGGIVIALSLLPLSTAFATEEPTEQGHGTASTSLSLATLVVEGLPADLSSITLGSLLSYASTDPDDALNVLGAGEPFAQSSVVLPVVGEQTVTSDGTGEDPGQTVTLPGGLGEVTAGRLLAAADESSATSVIHALEAALDAAVVGVSAGVPSTGAFSVVDSTSARAVNGGVVEDVTIDLPDLIPVEVLEQLPLSVLIDLADELDVTLSELLKAILAEVRALEGQLQKVVEQDAAIDLLQQELAGLEEQLAALGDPAELEALAETLASQIAVMEAVLAAEAALETVLATLGVDLSVRAACDDVVVRAAIDAVDPILCPALEAADADLATAGIAREDLEATLAAARQQLTEVQQELELIAQLNEQIDALQVTIGELLTTLNGLLEQLLVLVEDISLDDLVALLEGLVDGLASLELLHVGELVVGVESNADFDGSTATAVCAVEDVRVLGVARDVSTCEQAQAALADVRAAVLGIVESLPVVADVTGDVVRIDGLVVTTSEDNARSGSYYTASSAVEGLRLEVDPISLTQVTDDLVVSLTGTLDEVLAELLALIDGAGVDTALVEELVAEVNLLLDGIVAELPTGELLDGVVTPRFGLSAVDIGSEAMYTVAGTGTPIAAPSGPGALPAVPVTTPGTNPTTPQLPHTGGSAALALLLLAAGGGLAHAARGRRRTT